MSIKINSESRVMLNQESNNHRRESDHSDLASSTERVKQLQPIQMVKAKEAENINVKPTRITRQASLSALDNRKVSKSEKEEIASRSAEIWDCVGRKPNQLGGYIYQFKIKPEYEPFTQYSAALKINDADGRLEAFKPLKEKSRMIHPAVEVIQINDIDLILGRIPENISLIQNACDKLPKESGFSQSGQGKEMLVNLPDREALMANWEHLREARPEFPTLDIAEGEGIASDIEFVEAYFTHDAFLSSGKEFFHDWTAHVAPTLLQMIRLNNGDPKLGKPSFKTERVRMVNILAKIYRRIVNLKQEIEAGKYDELKNENVIEKLNFVLGYITDLVSNKSDESWTQLVIDVRIQYVWDKASGLFSQDYLQRRFGRDNVSDVPFKTIWEQAIQIEEQVNS